MENLASLRGIVTKLQRERPDYKPMRGKETDQFQTNLSDPEANRRNLATLMERYPTVFGEWFVRTFPDPQTWLMSRLGYARTTAVMSMVGYVIGLGDRHAENIMYDSTNGDTVHVDLNCMFNRGDELKIPEVVPFRLTQNLVHALGPTGVEGPFRIACEASLDLMRRQKDVLMCALRPFYFDPLVDWVKGAGRGRGGGGDADSLNLDENATAVEKLGDIERRLEGFVGKAKLTTKVLPLSVVGQVNVLINEATNLNNLANMYLGWAPYM